MKATAHLSLALCLCATMVGCVLNKNLGNSETSDSSAGDDSPGDNGGESADTQGSAGDDASSSGDNSSGNGDSTTTSGDGDADTTGDGDADTTGDGDGDADTTGDGDADTTGDGDGAELQCVQTGGVWDPSACDHWVCGLPNECEAEIPGCNCGAGRNFDESLGCVDDSTCPDPLSEGEVCDPTAPQCGQGLACCYPCGVPDCDYVCEVAIDGECPDPPP